MRIFCLLCSLFVFCSCFCCRCCCWCCCCCCCCYWRCRCCCWCCCCCCGSCAAVHELHKAAAPGSHSPPTGGLCLLSLECVTHPPQHHLQVSEEGQLVLDRNTVLQVFYAEIQETGVTEKTGKDFIKKIGIPFLETYEPNTPSFYLMSSVGNIAQ